MDQVDESKSTSRSRRVEVDESKSTSRAALRPARLRRSATNGEFEVSRGRIPAGSCAGPQGPTDSTPKPLSCVRRSANAVRRRGCRRPVTSGTETRQTEPAPPGPPTPRWSSPPCAAVRGRPGQPRAARSVSTAGSQSAQRPTSVRCDRSTLNRVWRSIRDTNCRTCASPSSHCRPHSAQ